MLTTRTEIREWLVYKLAQTKSTPVKAFIQEMAVAMFSKEFAEQEIAKAQLSIETAAAAEPPKAEDAGGEDEFEDDDKE